MPVHLASLALIPMGWGIAVIVATATAIAAWPDAMLRVTPMPAASILLYAAGLAWLCIWRSKIHFAGLALMFLALALYATTSPPDALISPDAKLIAIRTQTGFVVLRQKKASSFILAQWQPIAAGAAFTPFDPTTCAQSACQFGPIAVVPTAAACPQPATVILSPQPLRHACDAQNRIVIDRFSVWRQGATAIWLQNNHKTRILTDKDIQGTRPWVPPWPDW
jgi:competence protein ComEC